MRRVAVLLSVLGWAVACGGDNAVAPPSVASIQVTPGQDTLVTFGRTRQFNATPLDAQGNPVSGVTVVWTSSNPGVATVDPGTGLARAVGNGLSQIRASVGAITGQATLAVAQVVAGVVVTPPTASFTTVGVTQGFNAEARDSSNAPVAGVRFLWGSSNPAVATVDTLGITTARGTGQTTISAAGRGVPGYAGVTVTQTASQLVFSVGPSATVAGEAVNPAMQVEVRDAAGTLVAGSRAAITLGFVANPGGTTLHGSTTVSAVGGIATFSGITIEKAAAGYTLSAGATALTSGTSATFTVSPATPKALQFVTLSASDTAGQPLPFQVRAVDRFGNLTPSVVGSVTIRFTTNPTGAPLVNGSFFPTVTGGIADLSLSNLSVQRAGVGYRFSATGSGGAAGLDSAVSELLTVNPGSPAALAFLSGPGAGFFGSYVIPQQVRVQDLYANAVTVPATVTIGLATNPWGAAFAGTLTRSGTGIVVFDSLLLNKPGLGYLLVASSTGLIPDTNTALNVALSIPSSEAAGGGHTCVLVSGIAACWGDNTFGQLGRPGGDDSIATLLSPRRAFAQLTAGARHTCALDGAGAAWCWGDNASGQLGNAGAGSSSATPVAVGGAHTFTALSAGDNHTCGLATGGIVYCWGANGAGQLGDSGKVAVSTTTPTPVYGGLTYRAVAAGGSHACALVAADSTLRCWGDDTYGQLGDSTLTVGGSDTAVVVRGGLKARSLGTGASHTCVSTAVYGYCWGRNNHGQVGNDNLGVNADKPDTVNGSPGVLSGLVALGGDHSCAINSGGNLWCWGSNASGELGNGLAPADGAHAIQVPVGGVSTSAISAGATHTCARIAGATGAKDYCWGGNTQGQVGDGTTTNRSLYALVKEQL